MISIIICSRSSQISSSLIENIRQTIGCEYELIVADNSTNQFSIFSAYNWGISQSKFPYLCLMHEDIECVTKNWGLKLIEYLSNPKTGFIGVAGGQAVLRVPFGWSSYNPFCNIIHSYYSADNILIDENKVLPKDPPTTMQSVVTLDGVFLCARRELFNEIKFDENFDGFHCYDLDITTQAAVKGYKNYVVYDIDLKHFSKGKFDESYIISLLRFQNKWKYLLPIFESSISKELISKILYNAERNALLRLRKRMVRTGMPDKEIYFHIKHYTRLTGTWKDKLLLIFLPLDVIFIRLTSILRKKMIYQIGYK